MTTLLRDFLVEIPFKEFEVCWAGPNIRGLPGFCFGSEDGRILFTDELGSVLGGPEVMAASGEAVNGMADHSNHFAVSTRSDVTVWTVLPGKKANRSILHSGSHGLAVTGSGKYIASVGRLGLIILDPVAGVIQGDHVLAPGPDGKGAYVCRTVVLRGQGKQEVFVCAMRSDGIGAIRFTEGIQPHALQTVNFEGFDAIDVCGIGLASGSLAVAAAGKDGTIMLSRDVLADRQPQTRKMTTIRGIVYRILSCRGHVIVLTSRALYVLLDLASEFLSAGGPAEATVRSFVLSVTAVDANLCHDKYVLVVTADNKVLRIDVERLMKTAPADLKVGEKVQFEAAPVDLHWERAEVEQGLVSVE